MAWDINRVMLVGRLACDVDLKASQSGVSIASFAVAVGGKPDRNGQDSVSFFDCVSFGRTAENLSRFCKKGSQVAIEGRLEQQRWKDTKSGNQRSKVVILIDRVEFLGIPQGDGQARNDGARNHGDTMSGGSDYDNTFDSTPLDEDYAPF